MNPLVVAFFLHNTLATLFLGIKFWGKRDMVVKDFGLGLILNGVAYAVWTLAVILRPDNLKLFVTLGAIFFIASLVTFLLAGIQNLNNKSRQSVMLAGAIVAVVLFFVRTFIFPSQPGFSPEGFFFFNLHPVTQVIYIFGLAFTALPGIHALAAKFNQASYSRLVLYGLIAQVMGGVMLITSSDVVLLNMIGWIIGISYLLLWSTLLFNPKAWSGVS